MTLAGLLPKLAVSWDRVNRGSLGAPAKVPLSWGDGLTVGVTVGDTVSLIVRLTVVASKLVRLTMGVGGYMVLIHAALCPRTGIMRGQSHKKR